MWLLVKDSDCTYSKSMILMLLISTDGIHDIDNTTMDVIEAMKYLNHHLKLQLFRSLDFNLMIKRKIICRLHDTLVLTSQGLNDTRGKDGKSHHVTTTFGPSHGILHRSPQILSAERRDALGRKAKEQGADMRMQRQILEVRGRSGTLWHVGSVHKWGNLWRFNNGEWILVMVNRSVHKWGIPVMD